VEILGRYLNVYGMGAIKFVDKQWNTQKAHDVHTVKFSYINFNNISPILGRIKG
jgi:leucine-rich repeat-containing protein 49